MRTKQSVDDDLQHFNVDDHESRVNEYVQDPGHRTGHHLRLTQATMVITFQRSALRSERSSGRPSRMLRMTFRILRVKTATAARSKSRNINCPIIRPDYFLPNEINETLKYRLGFSRKSVKSISRLRDVEFRLW